MFITNITFSGGQSYYESSSGSLGLNLDIDSAIGIDISEKTAIVPYFMGKFTGTQQLEELADGTMLFQKTIDYKGSLNVIHRWNDNFMTEIDFGYKKELLSETIDEGWGEGLYDYYRKFTGFDLIWEYERKKYSAGYNYYQMRFPNYDTLASWVGFTQMGAYIYDFDAHNVVLNYKTPFLGLLANINYNLTYKNFLNQYIYTSDMNYSDDKREDLLNDVEVNLNYRPVCFSFSDITFNLIKDKTKRMLYPGLNLSFTWQDSSQNMADSAAGVFLDDYYDYYDYGIGTDLGFRFSGRINMDIYYNFSYRHYPGRYVQIFSDTYDYNEKMNEKRYSYGMSYYTPVIYNINFRMEYNAYRNRTNTVFNSPAYEYNAYNLLAGISWNY